MKNTPQLHVYTGVKAWDIIWKWTWTDYVDVLAGVGFKDIRTLKSRGTDSLNAATR